MNENQKTKSMQNKLENLIKNRDFKHALAISDSLHPAEIAEVISIIDEEANNLFIAKLKTQVIAEIINYVDPIFRTKIIQNLKVKTISSVLKNLSDDIATDILQSLSTKKASLVLKQLPKNTSLAINKLSAYEADTAGGRMTGQKISVKPQQNIVEVQNQIRTMKPDFREPFYIYVIDKNQKLIGTMNLRALFATEPDVSVESVTDKDVISVLDTTDQEETARLLKQYNLLALPVVDKKNRLLGTVTHDDLVDVLEEEATEDMFRIVGVDAQEDLSSIRRSIRFRLPWLIVNLILVMIAAYIVALFEDTIDQMTILAAFLPVVAGQGGNAGIQTLTVVVRSLALGRISSRDTIKLIRHELISGLFIGLTTSIIVSILAIIWLGNPILGFVIGLSLTISVLIGVLAGLLIPMGLTKLNQDPALSAGIWLTAITDLLGFLSYLTLATILLNYLVA
jgi:magnesium transporter